MISLHRSGADPGFLKRGFKCRKGGSFALFQPKCFEIPHENGRIRLKRGVRANPLNPL